MTFTVLVVCSANVCRSPMTVAVLGQRFLGTALSEDVEIACSGEHAWTDLAACGEVAGNDVLMSSALGWLGRHEPTQLSQDAIRRADMILAADRAVRSSIVRLDPRAHDHTFTLREAAALAEHVVETKPIPNHPTTKDSLRWLTGEMNDSRGLIAMPSTHRYRRTFLPWPKIAVHDQDVPDAHGDAPAPHRVVRELILDATDALTRAFLRSAHWEPRTNHHPTV